MKTLLSFYWRCRIVLFALNWIPNLQLGDTVIYQGRKWCLVQGVCRPRWTLSAGEDEAQVMEEDFHAPMWSNGLRRFRYGYRFYMTSWHAIWVHQGIKPWMRGCRIWGGDK